MMMVMIVMISIISNVNSNIIFNGGDGVVEMAKNCSHLKLFDIFVDDDNYVVTARAAVTTTTIIATTMMMVI